MTCPCELPNGDKRIYFCEHLQTKMTPNWCKLYQTKDSYRIAWEEGRGPGQSTTQKQTTTKTVITPNRKKAKKKRPILLGDMVSNALAIVGITEERVTKMIGRPCGCGRRKRKLNQLHLWAKRVLSGKTENAEEYLREMMDETP